MDITITTSFSLAVDWVRVAPLIGILTTIGIAAGALWGKMAAENAEDDRDWDKANKIKISRATTTGLAMFLLSSTIAIKASLENFSFLIS